MVCIIAGVVSSCSSPTSPGASSNPADSTQPIKYTDPTRLSITGFSRDTILAGDTVTIFGKNVGASSVTIGRTGLVALGWRTNDTAWYIVPPTAHTGFVVARHDSIGAQSPHQLVVLHPLKLTRSSTDSATKGSIVTLYGDGIPTDRDSVILLPNHRFVPIDSLFEDHLVFHVPETSTTGNLQLIYRNKAYSTPQGTLTIVRNVAWKTVTISLIGVAYDAQHRRTGSVDGGRVIDSNWSSHDTLNYSVTYPITSQKAGISDSMMSLQIPLNAGSYAYSALSVSWDSVHHAVNVAFTLRTHAENYTRETDIRDTTLALSNFYGSDNVDADKATVILIPASAFTSSPYQDWVTRFVADRYGDHHWSESTTFKSTTLGLGRIEIEFRP